MKVLTLDFDQGSTRSGHRNTLVVTAPHMPSRDRHIRIDFIHTDKFNLQTPQVLDGYVNAIIFFAMEHADVLRINGSLSVDYLRNIKQFQEAWHCWLPNRYKPVKIEPTSAISNAQLLLKNALKFHRNNSSISAFSGGVDAAFTLLRNSREFKDSAQEQATYNINDVVMIHGFDVKLENESGFSSLQQRVQPIFDHLNVDCHVVKTNLRSPDFQNWEHSFASQLSCILHQFTQKFSTGLIGSSEPVSNLINAWGSHPATDHLLSGANFKIVHDGAGYSRTDKVAFIGTKAYITDHLKVCWEGAEQHKNCGVCEKCIRTKLNFIAANLQIPKCFENPLSMDQIVSLTPKNDAQMNELKSIIDYSNKHGTFNDPFLERLKERIEYLA